jgi:hypothetical protein
MSVAKCAQASRITTPRHETILEDETMAAASKALTQLRCIHSLQGRHSSCDVRMFWNLPSPMPIMNEHEYLRIHRSLYYALGLNKAHRK